MAGRLAPLLLLQQAGIASALTVATLSNHDPTTWSKDSGCNAATDDRGLVACNLRVYEAAVKIAAASKEAPVDVVLFPEGYALAGDADVRRCVARWSSCVLLLLLRRRRRLLLLFRTCCPRHSAGGARAATRASNTSTSLRAVGACRIMRGCFAARKPLFWNR
jgi:hypothetical protein